MGVGLGDVDEIDLVCLVFFFVYSWVGVLFFWLVNVWLVVLIGGGVGIDVVLKLDGVGVLVLVKGVLLNFLVILGLGSFVRCFD